MTITINENESFLNFCKRRAVTEKRSFSEVYREECEKILPTDFTAEQFDKFEQEASREVVNRKEYEKSREMLKTLPTETLRKILREFNETGESRTLSELAP